MKYEYKFKITKEEMIAAFISFTGFLIVLLFVMPNHPIFAWVVAAIANNVFHRLKVDTKKKKKNK